MYNKQPSLLLACSGYCFLVPACVAFTYGNVLTAVISGLLSVSSVWFHLHRTDVAFIIDQIMLYSVVVRGLFDGYAGGLPGITIWLVIMSYNYIVWFSPVQHHFAQNPIIQIASRWHMTIHILAIVGVSGQQLFIEHPSS